MSRAFFGAFGKRCHAQIWYLRQKVSRPDEGRISRTQSALEQDYQNLCISSSEAGGLPFHHHLHSFTKAQLFLLNARHHMVNALRSERILSVFAGSLPPLMSSTAKGLISSRSTANSCIPFGQFGTGEDRHIEDVWVARYVRRNGEICVMSRNWRMYGSTPFTPMSSAGPAAIHVKPRRLSRVLGPAR
jgi:hypothetical protein